VNQSWCPEMPDKPGFSERDLCKDDINVEIIMSQINFLLPRIDDFIDLESPDLYRGRLSNGSRSSKMMAIVLLIEILLVFL